ncbi:carbohydrate sulfotransferase 8-like isoform X1 [Thunnus maccoyii]|uniref:carbohydrate sulfotransferase 8-like isoform X1 n=2 Tax=Thunnus maccoyii TaxID=8240 RepID=UPI001C4B543E|nr:carbohydrate sulfotransferase 8-like isoform X1 [Thunnus maccoyii]XP_042267306.1 carbohydrate sulfotransferase 8-like isoform X1 [Thunnus maccoyii]XP_042267307.1 carbohydrate sulfotransferase 8-like isoform X1 [Thunnus maccoyii]
MNQVDFRQLEAACVRRRLLSAVMKLPCSLYCSLWFLLLLGAGSLLLLVRLQDLTEMVQQQTPGMNVVVAPRWPIEKDLVTGSTADAEQSEDVAAVKLENSQPSLPDRLSDPLEDAVVGSKQPVTKRHRKLLLKSSIVSSSAPAGEVQQQLLQQRQKLARTQESRRRLLSEVCAKYQPSVTEQLVSQRQVSRVYVEDRSRLLYCEVPKAGCSNWKRVLMVLGGSAVSTRDIPHDVAHYANHLQRLESYDRAGIAERLRSYNKVLFVREPFERLVSAFRDKFESPNSYYHPVFGRPIISRYRANASRTALRTGAGVTFREFVQYLLDVRRPVGMDIHWEPVSQLCNPCLLRYNFIGKFERLEEEANFLLQSIGAPRNLTFPDFKDRNPLAERTSSSITQKYFAQLNSTERQKAYDFYYMDYLMFNYPKPFKDLH